MKRVQLALAMKFNTADSRWSNSLPWQHACDAIGRMQCSDVSPFLAVSRLFMPFLLFCAWVGVVWKIESFQKFAGKRF
jgi:hypothetical protein